MAPGGAGARLGFWGAGSLDWGQPTPRTDSHDRPGPRDPRRAARASAHPGREIPPRRMDRPRQFQRVDPVLAGPAPDVPRPAGADAGRGGGVPGRQRRPAAVRAGRLSAGGLLHQPAARPSPDRGHALLPDAVGQGAAAGGGLCAARQGSPCARRGAAGADDRCERRSCRPCRPGEAVDVAAGRFRDSVTGMARFLDRHLTDEEEIVVPVILEHGADELG